MDIIEHKFNIGDVLVFSESANPIAIQNITKRHGNPPYQVCSIGNNYVRFDSTNNGWWHSNFKNIKSINFSLEGSLFEV